MNLLDTLISDLAENVLRGAAKKAVDGFVAKKYISQDQEAVMVQGIVDEIQVALAIWKDGQTAATAAN